MKPMSLPKNPLKYLLGIAIIISIYSFGFVQGSGSGEDGSKISLAQAEQYHDKYMQSAVKINAAVDAYYLDFSTLNDLNQLKNQNPGAHGIRVYFGKDENNKTANVLVTVKDGKDQINGPIIKSAGRADICPNSCDSSSPIQKKG